MLIMQKITILGLVVAISMASGTMPTAEAEPIPSPYRQARDGVPIGEIVCAGDRMLMLSPSGMPACVFAGSVEVLERRGFVLLSEVPRDDLSTKQPGASEKAGGTGSLDASKTGDRPFVTTWRTASPNESITIPVGISTGAYTVDWGDGTVTSVTGDASHAYASPGEYQVVISGDFTRIYLIGRPNAEKLQSIDQWGDIQWESMNSAFEGAANMAYRATDVPDLSGVTDMSLMFHGARSFNSDLTSWDVSSVTDMSQMLAFADSFNGDISPWDVSGVTDMHEMFHQARSFNSDLTPWDVSSVTAMSDMFSGAISFNGDISEWDVSGVTDMSWMFSGASSFNGDISEWDVSSVTAMSDMFSGAISFNGDISEWDVSGVTDMSWMFSGASSFNGDISEWDVSGVTAMSDMFSGAISFNGDISEWDVSGVTDMHEMFHQARSFNSDLTPWDVSSVTGMSQMFAFADSFNGDISPWDVSGVTDMHEMFHQARSFNSDLTPWDVSGVIDMSQMFANADSFNQNLGNWYILLDGASIDIDDGARTIGNIAAQNQALDNQRPAYGIGSGGDSALFAVNGTAVEIKPSEDYMGKTRYTVNITSTGGFGKNNFRMVDITVIATESTPTPLRQMQNGIPADEVVCADGRGLMRSPSGSPACVFAGSVATLEQRGFKSLVPPKPHPIPQELAAANNAFAADFYRQVAGREGNHFLSPASMYIAFSALYEGAHGESSRQLEGAFGFDQDAEARHTAMLHALSSINREDRHAELAMANAFWLVENTPPPRKEYLDTVRSVYLGNLERIAPDATGSQRIGNWTYENTNGKLRIEPRVDGNTLMIIMNAIYFKGTWVTQFPPDATGQSDFYSGNTTVVAEMMKVAERFNYTATGGVQVLKMPYEGGRLSMLVALPRQLDGIDSLEDRISADLVEEWNERLEERNVVVEFPKFEMRTHYDLIGPLRALGVYDVFDGRADLSGISPGIFVSSAKQDAYVSVSEEGTEATATTSLDVSVSERNTPIDFVANHPFVFLIQDDESGAILFMGRVSDPTA